MRSIEFRASRLSVLRYEPITDGGLGDNEFRLGSITFYFLAQMGDMNPEIMRLLDCFRAPYFGQKLPMG